MTGSRVRLIMLIIVNVCLLISLVTDNGVEHVTSSAFDGAAYTKVERFKFSSGSQLQQLIKDIDYKQENWLSGIREVPRLFLTDIPSRWRDITAKELDVVTKKQVFFLFLGPLVLHSNELIQANRVRVASIIEALRSGEKVSASEANSRTTGNTRA